MNYYCPNCKNLIKRNDSHCIECGTKLKWDNPDISEDISKDSIEDEAVKQVFSQDESSDEENKTIENMPQEDNPEVSVDISKDSIEDEAVKQVFPQNESSDEENKTIENMPQEDNPEVSVDISKDSIENKTEEQVFSQNISINETDKVIEPMPQGGNPGNHDINKDKSISEADEEENKENQEKTSFSGIVLRLGIVCILLLLLSLILWTYVQKGDLGTLRDLEILTIYCSPVFIFGIVAIVLGVMDLAIMKESKGLVKHPGRSVTGIILGAFAIGITTSLILIRWVLL